MATETIRDTGGRLVDHVKQLVHEGNVRRIIVKHEDETIAEFPVTAAVAGFLLAPMLAAIGALTAVLTNCTIEVQRTDTGEEPPDSEISTG